MLENRFTNRLRETIRLSGYSIRIENAYLHWCDCFVRFHELRHPATLGAPEVVSRACLRIEAFLTHLAAHEQVSASTQNQALSALLFLYREVLYKVLVFEAGKGAIASGGKEGVQIELVELALHGNLADVRNMTFMNNEARKHFSQQNKSSVAAIAVVINSKFQMTLVNLYQKINKPLLPTKFFEAQPKAEEWLSEMIAQHQKKVLAH